MTHEDLIEMLEENPLEDWELETQIRYGGGNKSIWWDEYVKRGLHKPRLKIIPGGRLEEKK